MNAQASLLSHLDEQQLQAALALRGPVCILAGAGTGKTRTITHRIAYGVQSGVFAPQRVLALTFTTRAAAELRLRLRHLGTSGVSARTFHSAALSQLSYFWPQLVGGAAPSVLSGKGRLIGQAAAALQLQCETETLRDVAAEIEWRKVNVLTMEQYCARAGLRPSPAGLTHEQLYELMDAYEELKDERRQIDFEDVLTLMTGMIQQEPRVAAQIRAQYRHFVVDEFQDVSPLQYGLLTEWLGGRNEVCVVGDPSQTIFTFAGASQDFLLQFPREFPGADVVRLERNYRSEAQIVAAANALMRSERGALTLRAGRADAAKAKAAAPSAAPVVQLVMAEHDHAEAAGIAEHIAALAASGVALREVAVLFRLSAQSAALERALSFRMIPFQVRGSGRFFERPVVKEAIYALRAAALVDASGPLFQSVSDVLRSLGWSQEPPQGAAARERWDALAALMSLAEDCAPGTSLRVFADELSERQLSQDEPALNAVSLSTIHAAKGLEWDHVCVAGVSDGMLPFSFAESPEELAEERRLLYVAITRARRSLRLSWARQGGRSGSRSVSRFLRDVR